MNSKSTTDLLIENIFPCFSQFTLPSLGINHHWAFCAYNCITKQVRKIPLIFMKCFPELLATFKKLCFRISLNDDSWYCKTLYRYNSCARYLRISSLNVLYFTCINSQNFLNFDFGYFANANFYKLLNPEFFENIILWVQNFIFFWNKILLKQAKVTSLCSTWTTHLDVVAH